MRLPRLRSQRPTTHATAYYISVTGGSFTEVSALGTLGCYDEFQAVNNAHKSALKGGEWMKISQYS